MKESIFPKIIKEYFAPECSPSETQVGGLTKRELFAAMAMQGILSAGPTYLEAVQQMADKRNKGANVILSELAVDFANELLKELSKEDKE